MSFNKIKNGLKKSVTALTEQFCYASDMNTLFPFYLTLDSSGKLSVKGCSGIIDYNDDGIVLLTKEMQIVIKGKSLSFSNYSENETVISGQIALISFDSEGGEQKNG